MRAVFRGACVALVTPFRNGEVDFEALKNLIEIQLDSGTDAILVLGTTGEASTINEMERKKIITFARAMIPNDVKLIVGTGTNDTRESLARTLQAEEFFADAALLVTPYYNKCTMEGAYQHYKYIADRSSIPLIVYNVPSRTGVNLTPDAMQRIASIDHVAGIKESCGNIQQIIDLFSAVGKNTAIYSGDDPLNYTFLTLGGSGCISVTANVFPKQVADMHHVGVHDFFKAKEISEQLKEINKLLFLEVNPSPVKYALALLGLCAEDVRLPLVGLTKDNKKQIASYIERYTEKDR